jgi:hypothetical protein
MPTMQRTGWPWEAYILNDVSLDRSHFLEDIGHTILQPPPNVVGAEFRFLREITYEPRNDGVSGQGVVSQDSTVQPATACRDDPSTVRESQPSNLTRSGENHSPLPLAKNGDDSRPATGLERAPHQHMLLIRVLEPFS